MQKKLEKRSNRDVVMTDAFREDLRFWAENDRKLLLKLLDLMEAIVRDPFRGVGKPEPLRHKAGGAWSRRINQEHRVVYLISEERIDFLQARHHY